MLAIIADTYMESYGSCYYLFKCCETEQECLDFMTEYNIRADNFYKEYSELGPEPDDIWRNETDDDPINIKEIQNHRDKQKAIIDKYQEMGLIVGDSFYYYDNNKDNLFKFNLDNYKQYIENLDNPKPIYIGGYCE